MENASKALIIAGAIIVSIVIISLGVMIVGNVSGIISSQSDMSSQEVQAFNSKFLAYEGTQKGSNARALYNLIKSHNNTHTDDPSLQIGVTTGATIEDKNANTFSATEKAPVVESLTLKTGLTYTVSFGYDKNSGRIVVCDITEKNK